MAQGSLGEVQMVTVKFCIPIKDVERIRRKDMGGGCLMDIGLYPLQLACMVYDEMPEKITTDGVLNSEGRTMFVKNKLLNSLALTLSPLQTSLVPSK